MHQSTWEVEDDQAFTFQRRADVRQKIMNKSVTINLQDLPRSVNQTIHLKMRTEPSQQLLHHNNRNKF